MMAGQLPQEAMSIFMLITPDQLTTLAAPMSLETAQQLLSQVPADFMQTLLEQSLGLEPSV